MPYLLAAFLLLSVFLTGCSTQSGPQALNKITGESILFIGTQPGSLGFPPIARHSLHVRNTYLDNLTNTVHYEEGRDYLIDYPSAKITRTATSRIPDFSTNILYGKEGFDHSKFAGYGNLPYFAFADYRSKAKVNWLLQSPQLTLLPQTAEKLHKNEPLKIVAFGDSITAGGEATQPKLIYWQRWADALQQKYPKSKITAINGATGGDTTRNGLSRLDEKVISQKPGLVLIAFGMNDANAAPFGLPVEEFAQNLRQIIDRVRAGTAAEIIVLSTFPPNPKWKFGSGKMGDYARASAQVAWEKKCAFADVYHSWLNVSAAKKPEDLLGNNINHPNDFGHGVYFQVLNAVGL